MASSPAEAGAVMLDMSGLSSSLAAWSVSIKSARVASTETASTEIYSSILSVVFSAAELSVVLEEL